MPHHIMVDLETLGQTPGCSILSIGAVTFDPHAQKLGDEFYCVVNRASCKESGLTEDASTLAWWARQNEAARKVIAEAETSEIDITAAMIRFASYIWKHDAKSVRVWGNGSDFDNAILAACYAATKQAFPWKFWNNRCFRTLKSLNPGVPMPRGGVYHNALDDAKTQASAAIKMLQNHK